MGLWVFMVRTFGSETMWDPKVHKLVDVWVPNAHTFHKLGNAALEIRHLQEEKEQYNNV